MTAQRGRRYPRFAACAQRFLTALHVRLYRRSGGRIGGSFLGSPVLVLVTRGRRTGAERHTPLLYLPHGDDLVVVASNGGTASHPAWWHNLKAQPRAEVVLGARRLSVTASEVTGDEGGRIWEKLVEMYPGYASYQRKTERGIPVVRLTPEGSAGG